MKRATYQRWHHWIKWHPPQQPLTIDIPSDNLMAPCGSTVSTLNCWWTQPCLGILWTSMAAVFMSVMVIACPEDIFLTHSSPSPSSWHPLHDLRHRVSWYLVGGGGLHLESSKPPSLILTTLACYGSPCYLPAVSFCNLGALLISLVKQSWARMKFITVFPLTYNIENEKHHSQWYFHLFIYMFLLICVSGKQL